MENYYVYVYLNDNGDPYYVGMGRLKRAWKHTKGRHGTVQIPSDASRIILLEQNLSKNAALSQEYHLIQKYGRKKHGGLLENRMPGYIPYEPKIPTSTVPM
jgi:predicted GIY-YIG superfamily endonuclease